MDLQRAHYSTYKGKWDVTVQTESKLTVTSEHFTAEPRKLWIFSLDPCNHSRSWVLSSPALHMRTLRQASKRIAKGHMEPDPQAEFECTSV